MKILILRPPLTHLIIPEMFDSEETAHLGEELLHTLATSMRPTLTSLNLGFNEYLWQDEARFYLLLKVLQQQQNLEDLQLAESVFTTV